MSKLSKKRHEDARKAMINLMNSYMDALKERDVDKITSHYLRSPEFMLYADGKRQSYDELVDDVRGLFSTLKNFEGRWDAINVSVLNPDAVAALGLVHEVLTDKNGVETRLKGEVTWLAVRVADGWKFQYAHAMHQPDTE